MPEENLEEKIHSKNRTIKILILIIIILIILLLLLYILGYQVGKIGYEETSADYIEIIEVSEETINWNSIETLNIFNNSKFNNEKIIAPNSNEVYEFAIKNTLNESIQYNINFEEENKYNINMKYKLKIDNIYIAGNENEWVSLEELNQNNIKVTKGSINVFSLEWKWVDDDKNDTYAGTQLNANYTLKLIIDAGVINQTEEGKNEL